MTTSTLPALTFRVLALRSPFRPADREFRDLPEGVSIAEALADLGFAPGANVLVMLDGREIERARWGEVVPAAGSLLVARAVPGIEAIVAAAVFVWQAAVGYVGAAYATGGYFGASMAVLSVASLAWTAYQLIFPGAPPKALEAGTKGQNLVDGTRNRIEKYAKVPIVCGSPRYTPPQAMVPYSRSQAGVTKVTQMFDFGRGPIDFRDLRIGTNLVFRPDRTLVYDAVMQADGDYRKIEVELRRGTATDAPITLVTDQVHEEAISTRLVVGATNGSGTPVARRTLPDITQFSVDLVFPQLFWARSSGSITSQSVLVRARYRRVGSSTWLPTTGPVDIRTTAASTGLVRKTHEFPVVTAGQYEVELTRFTQRAGQGQTDATYWAVLRSIRQGDPMPAGHARIVTRITGTSEINGSIDELSAIAERYAWNGTTHVKTRDPTAYYRLLLQDADNRLAISDADWSTRVDVARLAEISAVCVTERRAFDFAFDDAGTTLDRLRTVLTAARASFTMRDGKFSAVRDEEDAAIAGHFNPINTWGFKWTKTFPRCPHGLKVHYQDPLNDWLMVERVVTDDGFSENGSTGTTVATEFDEMTFPGIIDGSIAWMDARYHLAVHRLRTMVYEWATTWQHATCEVGDRARISHDSISKGLSWARVEAVTLNGGGDVVSVEVNQICAMETAVSYGVCIRRSSDFASVVKTINTVVGDQTTLTFTTPITVAGEKPAVGDLLTFGVAGLETIVVLVTDKRPGPDMTATLTAVDVADAVYAAGDASRPSWAYGSIYGALPDDEREPFDGPTIAGTSATSSSTATVSVDWGSTQAFRDQVAAGWY